MRIGLTTVLVSVVAYVTFVPGRTAHAAGLFDDAGPVPAGARVSLEFDRDTFFLGENVLIHFCLQNVGKEPFQYNTGGDYRGASRALRFKVTALDEHNVEAEDPDPSGICRGGIGGTTTLEPGKRRYWSLRLMRYRRIDEPGTYTIEAYHRFGWTAGAGVPLPIGTAKVRFVMPTPEQARQVVRDMRAMKKEKEQRGRDQKAKPFADFSALQYTVYLPILLPDAQKGDEDALEGIGSIPTPEATKALVGLLGHPEEAFRLQAAQALSLRLPDPRIERTVAVRGILSDPLATRRRLVEKTWRSEFAPEVLAKGREFLVQENRKLQKCGALIMRCFGGKADLGFVVRALDTVAVRPADPPRWPSIQFPPYDPCSEFVRALGFLYENGARPSATPATPGEAIAFVVALQCLDDFRPEGWQATCERLLTHPNAHVRKATIERLPGPPSDAVTALLPKLLNDPELSVAIYACRYVGEFNVEAVRRHVLRIVAATKDKWRLRAACRAAYRSGARLEMLRTLASRLEEEGKAGRDCHGWLIHYTINYMSMTSKDTMPTGAGKGLKASWTRFLADHAEAIREGRWFEVGAPELTPDLLAPGQELGGKAGKELKRPE
jgi:hypothetical protein